MTYPRRSSLPYHLAACLLLLVLQSCALPAPAYQLPDHSYQLPEENRIEVQLEEIQLELIGHEQDQLVIGGRSSLDGVELHVQDLAEMGVTRISSGGSDLKGTSLVLKVPQGRRVTIIQESGSIQVHDLAAHLVIETISAPIDVQRFQGVVQVNSRRGPIRIVDSAGEITALAEADVIEFQAVSGLVSGTNIIGAINFQGEINPGDSVRLETDHGAVNVQLGLETDVEIRLTSAGGRVVCTLPGMSGLKDQCQGIFGAGGGLLWIRTVSGPIRVDAAR